MDGARTQSGRRRYRAGGDAREPGGAAERREREEDAIGGGAQPLRETREPGIVAPGDEEDAPWRFLRRGEMEEVLDAAIERT